MYTEYRRFLREGVEGEVVTRFQLVPCRYLNINHAKPACMNYHYANMYKGKMILRIDDSDPMIEDRSCDEAIVRDLNSLNIYPESITRVSDYLEVHIEKVSWLMDNGLAYCDSTSAEEREQMCKTVQASAYRDISVEENKKVWKGMLEGKYKQYSVRAKIDYKNVNHFLRDPVICVYSDAVHPVTGKQHRIYPVSDFYTPLIDSIEGVTHAFEPRFEVDHGALYKWFVNKYQLKKVMVQDFTSLKFAGTPSIHENLRWFVNNRYVDGWSDLRLPTIQSLLKRGLLPITITEFMLEQSMKKISATLTWEQLWSMNKKNIVSSAYKFTAIKKKDAVIATITNYELEKQPEEMIQLIPKNEDAGLKPLYRTPQVMIDRTELKGLMVNDHIMLVRWGSFRILHLKDGTGKDHISLEYKPDDEDYKNRVKVMWLPLDPVKLVKVNLMTFNLLLDGVKSEDDQDWRNCVNRNSKTEQEYYSEAFLSILEHGRLVQFERVGFACFQKEEQKSKQGLVHDFIFIPDGKRKSSSGIKAKSNTKKEAL